MTTARFTATATLVVALATAGAGFSRAESENGPLRCEIITDNAGGMVSLEGVVHAASALAGSYSFTVKSSGSGGSSDIEQGGEFAAAAGETVSLGQMSLGSGSTLDATLTVTAAGSTVECDGSTSRI